MKIPDTKRRTPYPTQRQAYIKITIPQLNPKGQLATDPIIQVANVSAAQAAATTKTKQK